MGGWNYPFWNLEENFPTTLKELAKNDFFQKVPDHALFFFKSPSGVWPSGIFFVGSSPASINTKIKKIFGQILVFVIGKNCPEIISFLQFFALFLTLPLCFNMNCFCRIFSDELLICVPLSVQCIWLFFCATPSHSSTPPSVSSPLTKFPSSWTLSSKSFKRMQSGVASKSGIVGRH